jgi:hypothetical protein
MSLTREMNVRRKSSVTRAGFSGAKSATPALCWRDE